MERWIEWLTHYRAGYLLTYPGVLEELAFACVDRPPCDSLRALISVASQLTPLMRRRIERTFELPVHESYGLIEIGTVATRCELGRFHVHCEHCIVEIVDEEGQPCPPGLSGRVVVTALQNLAMPLFRYDTDDMAAWADGPCACGRTLPSFVDLSGRIRRYAVLPPGSRRRFNLIAKALDKMPQTLLRNLRRYQVHQYRDGRFELRIVSLEPMPDDFEKFVTEAWASGTDEDQGPLRIVRVDDIAVGPGGKRLDHSSDFFTDADKTD